MSYQEAIEDGITVKKGGSYSQGGYYPPCHYCGKPVFSWAYQRGVRYKCPDCRAALPVIKAVLKKRKKNAHKFT